MSKLLHFLKRKKKDHKISLKIKMSIYFIAVVCTLNEKIKYFRITKLKYVKRDREMREEKHFITIECKL